jgi:hypothetical protein
MHVILWVIHHKQILLQTNVAKKGKNNGYHQYYQEVSTVVVNQLEREKNNV